jgi:hypothetical protein
MNGELEVEPKAVFPEFTKSQSLIKQSRDNSMLYSQVD